MYQLLKKTALSKTIIKVHFINKAKSKQRIKPGDSGQLKQIFGQYETTTAAIY